MNGGCGGDGFLDNKVRVRKGWNAERQERVKIEGEEGVLYTITMVKNKAHTTHLTWHANATVRFYHNTVTEETTTHLFTRNSATGRF
jgi:hypothetical protein